MCETYALPRRDVFNSMKFDDAIQHVMTRQNSNSIPAHKLLCESYNMTHTRDADSTCTHQRLIRPHSMNNDQQMHHLMPRTLEHIRSSYRSAHRCRYLYEVHDIVPSSSHVVIHTSRLILVDRIKTRRLHVA